MRFHLGTGIALGVALVGALAAVPRQARPAARVEAPLRPRVLAVVYNPIIESEGGKRLTDVFRWSDPSELARSLAQDLRDASGGFVQYQVAQTLVVDAFPARQDGFQWTDGEYLRCARAGRGWPQPEAANYDSLVRTHALVRRVNRREIDEVWVFAMPHSGLYESAMAGEDAYFCTAPPLVDIETERPFILMGFDYERGVGQMLESMGHRTESIMRHVYGSWDVEETHAWNRFSLYDRAAPGKAGCGTVHMAPNSKKDYDFANPRPVLSSADDWLSYPQLTGKKRLVTCAEWGNGDLRLFQKWWLSHLPRARGRGPDGRLANWWKYVVDFTRYDESR